MIYFTLFLGVLLLYLYIASMELVITKSAQALVQYRKEYLNGSIAWILAWLAIAYFVIGFTQSLLLILPYVFAKTTYLLFALAVFVTLCVLGELTHLELRMRFYLILTAAYIYGWTMTTIKYVRKALRYFKR